MAYQRVTLSELQAKLGERTNTTFWTQDEFKNAMKEVVRLWQAMVGEWNTSISIPVTASNEHLYNVPRQIFSLTRVLWNGTPLTMCAKSELEFGLPGWQGQSGTPYYWAPRGMNLVVLAPFPTSGTITFQGYQEPPVMNAGGDYLNLGDEEVSKFMAYALTYLTFKEGSSELQATSGNVQELMEAAGEKNAKIRASAMYKKWMGIDRDKSERPIESGEKKEGARR